jgi:hypothetical protein
MQIEQGRGLRWQGLLWAPSAGTYRLRLEMPGGGVCRISSHPVPAGESRILLQAGYHPFLLELPPGAAPAGNLQWLAPNRRQFEPIGRRHFLTHLPAALERLRAAPADQGVELRLEELPGARRWKLDSQGVPRSLAVAGASLAVAASGAPRLVLLPGAGAEVRGFDGALAEVMPAVVYDGFQGVSIDSGPDGSLLLGVGPTGGLWQCEPASLGMRKLAQLPGVVDLCWEPGRGGLAVSTMKLGQTSWVGSPRSAALVRLTTSGAVESSLDLPCPAGLGASRDGRLYVVEVLTGMLLCLDSRELTEWSHPLPESSAAVRLACDFHGRVWTLDTATGLLSARDPAGRLLAAPVELGPLIAGGEWDSPRGRDLAFEPDGTLLVLATNFGGLVKRFRVALVPAAGAR